MSLNKKHATYFIFLNISFTLAIGSIAEINQKSLFLQAFPNFLQGRVDFKSPK